MLLPDGFLRRCLGVHRQGRNGMLLALDEVLVEDVFHLLRGASDAIDGLVIRPSSSRSHERAYGKGGIHSFTHPHPAAGCGEEKRQQAAAVQGGCAATRG